VEEDDLVRVPVADCADEGVGFLPGDGVEFRRVAEQEAVIIGGGEKMPIPILAKGVQRSSTLLSLALIAPTVRLSHSAKCFD